MGKYNPFHQPSKSWKVSNCLRWSARYKAVFLRLKIPLHLPQKTKKEKKNFLLYWINFIYFRKRKQHELLQHFNLGMEIVFLLYGLIPAQSVYTSAVPWITTWIIASTTIETFPLHDILTFESRKKETDEEDLYTASQSMVL